MCTITVFKAVMPSSVSAEMEYSDKINDADITKLIEASDREDENVSVYENHASDEIESDSTDNDFDIDSQQIHNM
ncbi:hypothetical protein NPIL_497821 [Nephila pilipes]|uniref:Uncharacterized protein n=1 Tax=Nephila pilipes TaxID=299642 RepID=A0A8X6PSX4_NEPPI|nr:hypothetical protein NPIL_497821 [Nephila pilipes]